MPAANIVSGFGPDGANTTDPGEIPFWGLVGGLCLFINGNLAVLVGYLVTVHDWDHRYLTQFLMVTIQTAWIPYITDMTSVGKASRLPAEENVFIPFEYEPSDADVQFVGAIGIVAILTYGFAFVGSIAFMVWSLYGYTNGNHEQRSGSYFKGRLGFYSGVLSLAGIAQLLLGTYCSVKFSARTLSEGPVHVAFLFVTYPVISILVGTVQFLNGLWGFARSYGYHLGANDVSFCMSLAMQWVLVLSLQIVAQIGYLPGGEAAAAAPTVAAFSLGLNLMPAYLDQKMRSLPAEFPEHYYAAATADDTEKGVTVEPTITQEALEVADLEAPLPESEYHFAQVEA
ncbi:expressed unknown protein [Seminavis robusta]|uniref:Uncharacterized protein n=1 Tax=Seminavis robusta TaxID=568900 RepID=A0A9N8D4S2_9STRA|nr:expressed unknown protein [Seminavis robusta]|eukprot:Sro1_g000380.1 n/a (342) ;mRNA; f:108619-109724